MSDGFSSKLNPVAPKISLVIFLTVCHIVPVMLVWKIGVESTNDPLINIFPYSHHLSVDIVLIL